MRQPRFGLVPLIGAFAVLGLGGGTALACLEPNIYAGPESGGPSSYGPNDPVPYSVTNTDAGAAYEIHTEGQYGPIQASGTAGDTTNNALTGSFPMPDLGPASRTVEIYATVEHDDLSRPVVTTTTVQYVPPAPPPPPPDDPPANQGANNGPAQQGQGATDPAPQDAARTTEVPANGEGGAEGEPVAAAQPSSVTESGLTQARASVTPQQAARNERAATPRAATRVAPAAALPTTELGIPTPVKVLALGTALALVLGSAATGLMFIARRRWGPDAGTPVFSVVPVVPTPSLDAQIEAELQEMIAEERARQLLRPGPSADPGQGVAGQHVDHAAAAEGRL